MLRRLESAKEVDGFHLIICQTIDGIGKVPLPSTSNLTDFEINNFLFGQLKSQNGLAARFHRSKFTRPSYLKVGFEEDGHTSTLFDPTMSTKYNTCVLRVGGAWMGDEHGR